jgi:hypothetical protein
VRLPASGGKLSQQQLREYGDSVTQASGAPTATQQAGSGADAAATPAPIAREVSIGRRDLIIVTFLIEDTRRILKMLMRVTDVNLDSTRGIQTLCLEEALGIENWYADCKGLISLNRSGNLAPADGQFFPCYQVKYTILKVEHMDDTIAKAWPQMRTILQELAAEEQAAIAKESQRIFAPSAQFLRAAGASASGSLPGASASGSLQPATSSASPLVPSTVQPVQPV